jgi:hypothetical protein
MTKTESNRINPSNGWAIITLPVTPENGNFAGSASFTTSHDGKAAEVDLFVNGTVTGRRSH